MTPGPLSGIVTRQASFETSSMGVVSRQQLPVSIAILAGGKSSRMGRDKALMPLGPENKPLIEHVIATMMLFTNDLMVIGEQRAGIESPAVRFCSDDFPEQGVLGGIGTAVRQAAHAHCLVVACDMPFINPAFIEAMIGLPRNYDVLAPVVSGRSRQGGAIIHQTLHSIYRKTCLLPIVCNLDAGLRQVVGIYNQLTVRVIAEHDIRYFDPDLHGFFSVNTPEALEQAEYWINGKQAS